jgi:molybdopterin-guanine dinucleotide biosynthesis protein A
MTRGGLCGAVLIGGRSRRMGRPKSTLVLGGRSFAARIAEALSSVVDDCFFVGRGELADDVPPLPHLGDAPGVEGPLGGILGALRHRPDNGWLIAACDLPLLSAEAARWLASLRAPDRMALLPRLGPARIEPLFALYEARARTLLEELAEGGARSLQGLAQATGVFTPTPPSELAAAWRNVNTEDELRALFAATSKN